MPLKIPKELNLRLTINSLMLQSSLKTLFVVYLITIYQTTRSEQIDAIS